MIPMLCRSVRMRDGTHLAVDAWLPDGPGPWPAVLFRTPYHRAGDGSTVARLTAAGYAYVTQDARGKYDSDGVFRPLEQEKEDGQDTLDWIASQSWCNGRIGMVGRSYPGIVQIPAAAGGHEALKCILPGVAPNSFFRDWIRYDGCFALANMVRWPLQHASCRTVSSTDHVSWEKLWQLGARGTVSDVEAAVGIYSPALRQWVEHDCEDAYWVEIDQSRDYSAIRCACMHQAGYFDHISRGQFEGFAGISAHGATEYARANQRLLAGPWGHSSCAVTSYGEWQFGEAAGIDLNAYELRFLDLWLRDRDDGLSEEPPVRYFLMGENRWEASVSWPPPGVAIERWYLGSSGEGGVGGRLGLEAPAGSGADAFEYDPENPAPTRGGPIYWGMKELCGAGPVDQRALLGRDDVLVYRSAPLDRPLRVVGQAEVDLWFASSARDTDVVAKLCVTEELGRVVVLTVGSIRCRYREGWDRVTPLTPGEATQVRIRLFPTAYTFASGSRVTLLLTSSSFPRILPHPNTIAPTWQESSRVRARQEIIHAAGHESALLLPVLPG